MAKNNTINDNCNEINPNIVQTIKNTLGNTVLIEYKQNTLLILVFDLNNKWFTKYRVTTVKKLTIIINNIAIKNILRYGIWVTNEILFIFALYIAVKYSFVIIPYKT